jgi:hypothetical protein
LDAPVCLIVQDWTTFASDDFWTHFATFEVPFICSMKQGLVHSPTFWPPAVETWSTRVEVVQFQLTPGQFGPA